MSRVVAVIGGNGFIGKPLVRMLLEAGYAVKVGSRSAGSSASSRSALTFHAADVASREAMDAFVQGAHTVVHMAMGGGNSWADFERDFIAGTRNVAEACVAAGVKRLVYVSSIAALYLGDTRTVIESEGPDPQPLARSMYSRAKGIAEGVALSYNDKLEVVIMRPGVVVGRGGLLSHSGAGYWPSDSCCLGWGSGTTPIPFVLVEDAAQAVFLAVQTPEASGKTFNLAGDVRPTAREFVRAIGNRSLRNFRFYPQSLLKLQMIEIFKWLIKVIAGKKENPFPSFRDLKSRSLRAQLDCSAAKSLLGWRPNGDPEAFYREAVDSHLKPVHPGDLRLARHA